MHFRVLKQLRSGNHLLNPQDIVNMEPTRRTQLLVEQRYLLQIDPVPEDQVRKLVDEVTPDVEPVKKKGAK